MEENKNKTFTEQDAVEALKKVKAEWGEDMARNIEKLARLETGHFKSTQFIKTGTGGMQVPQNPDGTAAAHAPYYGWGSSFFLKHPTYTPVGTTEMFENAGASAKGGLQQDKVHPRIFVVMPSVEAWMMFLAQYAEDYKNEGGIYHWYSTLPAQQAIYKNDLDPISTPITDNLA